MFKNEELDRDELERAVGGLKTRLVNEPLENLAEEPLTLPLKVRKSDILGSDRDPGHTDP